MAESVDDGVERIRGLLDDALLIADEINEPLIAVFISQAVALIDQRREDRQ